MQSFAYSVINNYRIIKLLGEGSFGSVFLVEDMLTNQRFTMKKQKDMGDEEKQYYANKDIKEEIKFLQTNDHPFIIKQIESFPEPGKEGRDARQCIILEHADGGSLDVLLDAREKPFSEI